MLTTIEMVCPGCGRTVSPEQLMAWEELLGACVCTACATPGDERPSEIWLG